jgi:hypothetical protein
MSDITEPNSNTHVTIGGCFYGARYDSESKIFKDDFEVISDRNSWILQSYKKMLENKTIQEVMVEQAGNSTVSITLFLNDGSIVSLSKCGFSYSGII